MMPVKGIEITAASENINTYKSIMINHASKTTYLKDAKEENQQNECKVEEELWGKSFIAFVFSTKTVFRNRNYKVYSREL